jgi:hypothetical protein
MPGDDVAGRSPASALSRYEYIFEWWRCQNVPALTGLSANRRLVVADAWQRSVAADVV